MEDTGTVIGLILLAALPMFGIPVQLYLTSRREQENRGREGREGRPRPPSRLGTALLVAGASGAAAGVLGYLFFANVPSRGEAWIYAVAWAVGVAVSTFRWLRGPSRSHGGP